MHAPKIEQEDGVNRFPLSFNASLHSTLLFT